MQPRWALLALGLLAARPMAAGERPAPPSPAPQSAPAADWVPSGQRHVYAQNPDFRTQRSELSASPSPAPPSAAASASEPDRLFSAAAQPAPTAYVPPALAGRPPLVPPAVPPQANDCLGCDQVGSGVGGWPQLPPYQSGADQIRPFVNLAVKAGDRAIGDGRLFVPLFQDAGSILFADVRGQFDDDDAVEGNFGLVYRELMHQSWILGGYIYYDRLHSPYDNNFNQLTIGGELLTLDWDVRVNGYFPQSGGQFVNTAGQFANGTIVLDNFEERAYRGIDAEIGRRVLHWGTNQKYEVRVFGGGFAFHNGASGFEEIAGPKFRWEFRAYGLDLFGPQSRLSAGIETSWDQVRNEQVFAFVRLRVPLHAGYRTELSPLRRRLADLPVRDPDVVTHRAINLREPAANLTTGQSFGSVVSVGSEDDLAAAAQNAGVNSTLLVDGEQFDLANGSLQLHNGQSLIGGGSTLQIFGLQTGRVATLTVPGMRPTIGGSSAANPPPLPVIQLADQNYIQGVDVAGGSHGVSGDQVIDVFMRDVSISGSSGNGISLSGAGNIYLQSVNVTNAAGAGIAVDQGAGILIDHAHVDATGGPSVSIENADTVVLTGSTLARPGSDAGAGATPAPAVVISNSEDVAVGGVTVSQAVQGVAVNGLSGALAIDGNAFDLTGSPALPAPGSALPAVSLTGIGADADVSITKNSVHLDRKLGQTAFELNLNSTSAPPPPGTVQAVVDLSDNVVTGLSGTGVELVSPVTALARIRGNQFTYGQIGLPGAGLAPDPAVFRISSTARSLDLDLADSQVVTGSGVVAFQPLTSTISATNSDLTASLENNEVPIDAVSLFRDAASTFVIGANEGNTFALKLAPGSLPIDGVE